MKFLSVFALALLSGAAPLFASVTVTSPTNGATVPTQFSLYATASPCSSQPIVAMGYSLDSSTSTAVAYSTAISTYVTASAGAHVLHVKSWGNQGASCVTDVSINVVTAATNVTVSAPLNGASVTSPFPVAASGTYCQGQPISAMGFSIDSSTSTTLQYGTVLSGAATSTAGAHTLHVKSWGNQGASCVTDLGINVTTPLAASSDSVTPSGPVIPSTATVVKAIQKLNTWQASFDTGTGGTASSSGVTSLATSPSISGSTRGFATTYSNYGGERYSVNFGADTTAENFVYDGWIYLASPINDIANVEMDLNQVMGNGQTVIFGFQCDGWSRTWDFTENAGTPTSPNDQWVHSNQTCNPQAWTADAWHHIQISYARDSSGNVTYQSVWFDGVEQDFNVTVPSAFALGWSSTLVTNLQIDGMTSTPGSATVYMDNLTISRW